MELEALLQELFGAGDEYDGAGLTTDGAGNRLCPAPQSSPIPGLVLWKRFLDVAQQASFMQRIEQQGLFDAPDANQAMRFGTLPDWAVELCNLTPADLYPEQVASRVPLFDQMIANLYKPGEGMVAHTDLARFEDGICIYSFGGPAVMHFRRHKQQAQVLLEGGDLLMLSGEARYQWTHGIEAVRSEVYNGVSITRSRRISITLRRLQAGIVLCEPAEAAAQQLRLGQWERESGVVFTFVIGQPQDRAHEARLLAEEQAFGGFMRLPLLEAYSQLPHKTRVFFREVGLRYQADFVVKVDDDVYLMPHRLLLAMRQWSKMGAGYVGCMKNDAVWAEPGTRWFEPRHVLIGPRYWLHAYGSLYAMSGSTVDNVIIRSFSWLRLLANEDVSVGLWVLGHNVVHFDDRRLCSPTCNEAAVGVSQTACAGLCNPVEDMYIIHATATCHQNVSGPLKYIRGRKGYPAFEKMWVA